MLLIKIWTHQKECRPDNLDALYGRSCIRHILYEWLRRESIVLAIEHHTASYLAQRFCAALICRARWLFACIVKAQSKQEPVLCSHRLACNGFTVVIFRAC